MLKDNEEGHMKVTFRVVESNVMYDLERLEVTQVLRQVNNNINVRVV
jgi:hypothetical protein